MKCLRCQSDNPPTNRYCAECGTSLTRISQAASLTETKTLLPLRELETGSLFANRYQVIEKLGSGGMGSIYKVFDKKVKEKIALKLIKPEIALDEANIERFRNELRSARRIAHRNVCRMFDLGEAAETFFITMEYVPGETLKNIIRMTGPLSVGTAVNYARQVCEGLAEAHRWGVVHRDLKPQNIMIDQSGTARIMDFGIARSLQAKEWTGEGVVIGTPQYMSPEQAESGDIDPRTDIYSLGIILYEMVTGKVPFQGHTPLSVLLKQKTALPSAPREWNPQLPESLNRLILKCLEKKKEQRFQNAEELHAELSKIEAALPDTEKVALTAIKERKAHPGRPQLRQILIAIFFVLILAAGGYFLFRPKAPPQKSEPVATAALMWKKSIAVLLFEDRNPEQNKASLCEGMTDDIRTKLASISDLKVISKNSADQFKAPNKDLIEIGKILGVDNVLEGELQLEKENILVTVKLSDAKTGRMVWTQTYDEKYEGNFFKIEDRISKEIATKLQVRFAEDKLPALKTREPANFDAYAAFREGQQFEYKYRDFEKESDFQASAGFYQKAIDLDPDYALAYWGLGNLYESRFIKTNAPDAWMAMLVNFDTAFKKNDKLAEVHLGMGWVHFYHEDFDQAYESYKRAFDINPNDYEVNFNAGAFLRSIGLDAQAIYYYGRAMTLNPRSTYAHISYASSLWNLGQFEEGLRLLEQALTIDPESYHLHGNYARLLLATDNREKAEQQIRLIEKIMPDSDDARERLARLKVWLLALNGEKDKALTWLKNTKQLFRYEITNAFILLGRTEDALKYIKIGKDGGYNLIKDSLYPYSYLMSNPYFDSLRNDPRFQDMVKEAKAAFEAKQKKYKGLGTR